MRLIETELNRYCYNARKIQLLRLSLIPRLEIGREGRWFYSNQQTLESFLLISDCHKSRTPPNRCYDEVRAKFFV
jgi:hypothetical protein